MKTVFFSLLSLILAAQVAVAQESATRVNVDAAYTSDDSKGLSKYTVRFLQNGKVELTTNPNTCTGEGANISCTVIGLIKEVVQPVQVEDDRPVDGALILQLTRTTQLAITNSREGRSNKLAIYERFSQGGATRSYPLSLTINTEALPGPTAR